MKLNKAAKTGLMVLIMLIMILILLGMAEAGVRLRQWVLYGSLGHFEKTYEIDPATGLRIPIAGLKSGNLEINSAGFRSPEIERHKPKGRLRIAFLGASTTFCAEVSSNEMTWPNLVAENLKATYSEIDYINGGVPGYTAVSSIRNLKKRIKEFSPDIIVIYHATNDLSGEIRELAEDQGKWSKEDNVEESDWFSENSLLWFLVKKNLQLKQTESQVVDEKDRIEIDPQSLGHNFRSSLLQLIQDSKKVAPLVVIATFSYQIRDHQSPEQQLEAASSALFYMPMMTPQRLLESYRRYNEIIRDLAAETDILLVSGEMEIPGDSEHFNDTVHYKDAGSVLMAGRITEALKKSSGFEQLVQEKNQAVEQIDP